MDQEAEAMWRARRAPFDGATLATWLLELPRLQLAASALVSMLERRCGRPSLQTAEDWHEHDGYVSQATPTTWSQLEGAVAGERALRRSCPADAYVRRAWLALDGAFYLRWWAYDEYDARPGEPQVGGDVDLTAQPEIVEAGAGALAELGIDVEIRTAARFFSERWGG